MRLYRQRRVRQRPARIRLSIRLQSTNSRQRDSQRTEELERNKSRPGLGWNVGRMKDVDAGPPAFIPFGETPIAAALYDRHSGPQGTRGCHGQCVQNTPDMARIMSRAGQSALLLFQQNFRAATSRRVVVLVSPSWQLQSNTLVYRLPHSVTPPRNIKARLAGRCLTMGKTGNAGKTVRANA